VAARLLLPLLQLLLELFDFLKRKEKENTFTY
jgi:hypothetical protein